MDEHGTILVEKVLGVIRPTINKTLQIEAGGDPVFIEIEGRVATGWIPTASEHCGKARVERFDPVGFRDPIPNTAFGEDLAAHHTLLVRVAEPEHSPAGEEDVSSATLVNEVEQRQTV